MSGVSWVAGTVRARALARLCLGRDAARGLAACRGAEIAAGRLTGSVYDPSGFPGAADLEPRRRVEAALLWRLRVLAGWLPGRGAAELRALAGWYELRNVDDHMRRLRGHEVPPPFQLGALATGWPRLRTASSMDDFRSTLARSSWGDPGSSDPADAILSLQLSWGRRLLAAVPLAEPWVTGAAAVLVARDRWAAGHRLSSAVAVRAVPLLGRMPAEADTFDTFRTAIPVTARWVFADVGAVDDLWRAQVTWWRRVDRDGSALLRGAGFDGRAVLGAVLACAVDAWRVRAALACAGAGGTDLFDVLA